MSCKGSKGLTLAEYRAAIRKAWLPIVGRQQLSSTEYELTQEWFTARVDLNLILRAIHLVKDRSRRGGITIYSLGVIRADLEQLGRTQAQANVGQHSDRGDSWREVWAEDLQLIIEAASNPEEAAICRELHRDLHKITLDQAKARWREIRTKY
jgi:hypothetical protein